MRLHGVKFLIWIKHPMGIVASPIRLLADGIHRQGPTR